MRSMDELFLPSLLEFFGDSVTLSFVSISKYLELAMFSEIKREARKNRIFDMICRFRALTSTAEVIIAK